jgi:glycosyltransferase involved in cell wall biosynthesis
MRIGFDAKRAFHNRRGLGNYSRDLLRILAEQYPDHEYLLFNPKPAPESLFQPASNQQEIRPEGAIYRSVPSLWRTFGICNAIEQHKADIYHGLSQELPFGIHRKQVKTVLSFHDAIFMRYPEQYDALYRQTFIYKNRYSLKVADRIVAVSEQSKRDLIEFFGIAEQQIEVIYQGCNPLFRSIVSRAEKTHCAQKYDLPGEYILTVGALETRKNLMNLLQAHALGKTGIPLVIVGRETRYAAQLKEEAQRLKIADQVFFLHEVSNKDLPVLYQSALIFVFPSVYEGFGIPILEALCSGVPVITSSGSCFAETGGEAAMYVNTLEPEALSEAIVSLCGDSEMRRKMIEKGIAHSLHFSENKIADRWMNLYKSLL